MPPKKTSNHPITFTEERISSLPLREVRELHRAGFDTAWKGGLITDCPYRYNPETPDAPFDRERANAWTQGFSAGRTDLRIHRESTPQDVRDAHGEPGKL